MRDKILKQFKEIEKEKNITILYATISGSRLYGTENENSDLDVKFVFAPTKQDVLLKKDISSYTKDTNNSKEKNTAEDVDMTGHSIYAFFSQLEKSETGAVDVLFSMFREDTIVYEDKEFTDLIKSNYEIFLNKNMKSFIGYALGQTKKFGIKGARYDELDTFVNDFRVDWGTNHDHKLSTRYEEIRKYIKDKDFKYIKFVMAPANRNTGGGTDDQEYISVLGKLFLGTVTVEYFYDRVKKLYDQFGNRTKTIAGTTSKTDFKALSHSLRIAQEVQELLETGFIKFPLKDADHIRDIKGGKVQVEQAINEVQDVLAIVDELLLSTDLPEDSNREVMDEFIMEMLV